MSETIFFGYPYYGKVDGGFMRCVLEMVVADSVNGRFLIDRVGSVDGLYVSNNRNQIVDQMLNSDAGWLLMADSDTRFKPTLPDELLKIAAAAEALIVAVDVPLGAQDHVGMTQVRPGAWTPSETVDGWHDGAATAIMLIHRTVLSKITAEYGHGCWFLHGYHRLRDGWWIDEKEDMAFCSRAKALGHRVYVTDSVWAKHAKKLELPNRTADDGTGLIRLASKTEEGGR